MKPKANPLRDGPKITVRPPEPTPAGSSEAPGSGEITALDLVALQINEQSKRGTPEHAEALEMVEIAKQMWRERRNKKGAHCL